MSLCHKDLRVRLNGDNDIWTAELEGYNSPYELSYHIAYGLAGTTRFSGQLRARHYSVLHHTFLVGMTAEVMELSNDVVRQAYMHDVGEAFFLDFPSRLKLPIDVAREDAMIDEISEKLGFHIEKEKSAYVTALDHTAAITEALILGFNWKWAVESVFKLDPVQAKMHAVMAEILTGGDWFEDVKTTGNIRINQDTLDNMITSFPNTLQRLEII